VDLIESIGSVIGNAVENARLFEEAQRNLERIRALYEINLAITATLDLRSSMAILLEKIDSLLGYPTVLTMRFLEDATQLLKPIACRNLDEEEWKAYSYSISPSAFRASAVINKAPLIVSDIAASPGTRGPSFYRQHGLVSFLGIPLVAQEKVIGVLSVYTKEKHTFTPEEIELISAIGNQAAIAIHNAQLHEETKRQAEVAERANKVKSEFLSIMSHELRTPLTVVMGYGELMQQGALGDLSQKQADALQKMMSRSKDLLGLINGILEATRLESQAAKLESSQVSLSDLLEELKSQYAGLKGKELRIEWDYPLELPQIRTDGAKLKQILENLVNNAIKFTDRGSVTVTAGVGSQGSGSRNQGLAESGHLTPDTRWVEFKITDTGIGIPMEALPFIFERFRQVDSSDTRFHGGVGLGLYIAKRFAELLGGTISVKSEPGKGSTFTVTIPNPNT
jgi:signal transduction histidine kinase